MATQSISYESVSMPVSMATDGFDDDPESARTTMPKPAVKIPTTLKQVGTRRDYQMIDPRTIDIEDGFNARDYTLPENRAHLDRLKVLISQSIEEGGPGVEKPIIVRLNKQTGRVMVVDGECRLRAVLELIAEGHEILSMADIPCYPAPEGSHNLITRTFASLNANEGKPLSKWELGKKYQELYNQNVSIAKIALRTGNTETFVNEAMELASAPDDLKQLLSDQAVTPAEVKRILRSEDVPAEVSALQAAVAEKKAKGEKGPVKRAKAPSKSTPAPAPQPVQAAPVEGEAFDPALDTPVTLEYESPVPHPVSSKRKDSKSDGDAYKIRQFVLGLEDLLKDVDISNLTNPEMDTVSVKAEKLLALAHTVDRLTNNGPVNAEISPAAF